MFHKSLKTSDIYIYINLRFKGFTIHFRVTAALVVHFVFYLSNRIEFHAKKNILGAFKYYDYFLDITEINTFWVYRVFYSIMHKLKTNTKNTHETNLLYVQWLGTKSLNFVTPPLLLLVIGFFPRNKIRHYTVMHRDGRDSSMRPTRFNLCVGRRYFSLPSFYLAETPFLLRIIATRHDRTEQTTHA